MTGRQEIRSLTGFRGAAALVVAIYHFCKAVGDDAPFFLHGGYIAVDAFFILSGYVLSYNYSSKFLDRGGFYQFKEFIIKRIVRVYPAYIGILFFTSLKGYFDFSGNSGFVSLGWWDALGNLLMLTGWGLNIRPIIGVSWSVSAELFCYITFPLIISLIIFPSWLRAIFAAIFFATIVFLALSGVGSAGALDIVTWDNAYPLIRALCGFGLGLLAYSARSTMKSISPSTLDLLFIIVLVTLVCIWSYDHTDLGKYVLLGAIVLISAHDTPVAKSVFGNKQIYFVGEISYSLYLIHPLLVGASVRFIGKITPLVGFSAAFTVALALYLAVAIVLSAVSYRVLEMSCKNFILASLFPKRVKAI